MNFKGLFQIVFFSLRTALIFCLICLVFLCLIEGGFSTFYVARRIATKTRRVIKERRHTRYDENLGWKNIPNIEVQGIYGPGTYIKINAQGFRNEEDFTEGTPAGKTRVICSGDSYTLGYGVSNPDTWCEVLRSFDQNLQTINMGQGGYGSDQAFLWYQEIVNKFEHDVHIFAFVNTDIFRMKQRTFCGYGKPVLIIDGNGELGVSNVPVPKVGYWWPRLTQFVHVFAKEVRELRSIQLPQTFLEGFLGKNEADYANPRRLALKIFTKLKQMHNRSGRIFLVVHFPAMREFQDPKNLKGATEFFARELKARNINYLNLIDPMRNIPEKQRKKMFRMGHYSISGNKWVGKRIYDKLRQLNGTRGGPS